MASIANHDSAGTGALFSRVVAGINLDERYAFKKGFCHDDMQCLDAPQFIPAGSSVAFFSNGEKMATSTARGREA